MLLRMNVKSLSYAKALTRVTSARVLTCQFISDDQSMVAEH